MSKRMVVTLLNPMDGICRTYGLLVIAAINRPGSIEPALRRPGRLNREIDIGVPSPKQRNIMISCLICLRRNIGVKKFSDVSDSNMTSIVLDGCYDSTKGASDCSKDGLESASSSITYLPVSPKIQNAIDIRVNGACVAEERILKVKFEDFEKAQMKVRPSTMQR